MREAEELQVVALRSAKSRGRPFTRGNASEMGRRGGLVSAAHREDELWRIRELLCASAPKAAAWLCGVLSGEVEPDAQTLAAVRDILDRTIGKAPAELRIDSSQQTLGIIRELDDSAG